MESTPKELHILDCCKLLLFFDICSFLFVWCQCWIYFVYHHFHFSHHWWSIRASYHTASRSWQSWIKETDPCQAQSLFVSKISAVSLWLSLVWHIWLKDQTEAQRKIKQLFLLFFGWTLRPSSSSMNNVGCICILFTISLAAFGPGLLCQWSAAVQTKKEFINLLRRATGEVLPNVLYGCLCMFQIDLLLHFYTHCPLTFVMVSFSKDKF